MYVQKLVEYILLVVGLIVNVHAVPSVFSVVVVHVSKSDNHRPPCRYETPNSWRLFFRVKEGKSC